MHVCRRPRRPGSDAFCSGWKRLPVQVSAAAPGFLLHSLKGDRAGWWSVDVSGNWRVVFRFEHAEVVHVDLIDYH